MKKFLIVLLALLPLVCSARDFSWKRVRVDGSRTGVTATTADNVREALGTVSVWGYTAPNGVAFRCGATPRVAKLLIDAQSQMADVKQVIGYSPEVMLRSYPECALSDWYIDEIMRAVEEKAGKHVSVGITNFGGIRVDMPAGPVLKDDILSMFPFKNYLCFVELRGKEVRALLEQFAANSWQVVGGARCVVKDGKLVSALVDGKPIDDSAIYGVATISFLLNGGDDIFVARNAVSLEEYKDLNIIDVMLPYVLRLNEAGQPIQYQTDGRIVYE